MNDVRPWVEHIFDCFRTVANHVGQRLAGHLNSATPYQRWHTITERYLYRYDLPERDEIMCDTAVRFYGLN